MIRGWRRALSRDSIVAAQMQWFQDQGLVQSKLDVDKLVDDSFVKNY